MSFADLYKKFFRPAPTSHCSCDWPIRGLVRREVLEEIKAGEPVLCRAFFDCLVHGPFSEVQRILPDYDGIPWSRFLCWSGRR